MENGTTGQKGEKRISKKRGMLALSPLLVFVLIYLVTSLVAMDFYKVPITVAFMIASIYAVAVLHGIPLKRRIEVFSRGASTGNLILMLWIFVLAGAFANSAKTIGAFNRNERRHHSGAGAYCRRRGSADGHRCGHDNGCGRWRLVLRRQPLVHL